MLPVLEDELGPGVAAALARTADQLRADMELPRRRSPTRRYAELRPTDGARRSTRSPAWPPAVRTRVLRLAALAAGAPAAELFHEHVLAVDALLTDWHGQSGSTCPATCAPYAATGCSASSGCGAEPHRPRG